MRLGIIAAAGTEPSPDPLLGERDAGLVQARLELADVGFTVRVIDPGNDLAEQLDALLSAEPTPPDVLLYASCLLAVVEEGDCFLCLNPDEPDIGDGIRDVVTVLSERAASALLVLETRFDDRDADGQTMRAVIDALLDCVEGRVELIAAVRPIEAHPERIPSRMTAALLETIDNHEGPLPARQAYAMAIQSAELGRWPHAATYAPGPNPVALRPGVATVASQPPPSGEQRPTDPDGTRLEDEEEEEEVAASAAAKEATSPEPAPVVAAPPEPAPVVAAPPEVASPEVGSEPAPIPPAPLSWDRLSPASERKQAYVASVPARRQPASTPEPLPKVVITSRPPADSAPAPASEEPPRELPRDEPPVGLRRKRRRDLLDTSPGAPEALRAAEARGTGDEAPAAPEAPEAPAAAEVPKKRHAVMTVEEHVAAGDALRGSDANDEAIVEYKHALGKLGTATVPIRAAIYIRIGELSRTQGNRRVAISNFDKALSISPDDLGALEALIELNAADGNWRAVHSVEERFFAAKLADDVRFDHLVASGDRWREQADDKKRARERYQQARDIFTDRVEPVERLLTIVQDDNNIDQVIELRRTLIELESNAPARARHWFALGEYCMFEAKRERDALGAFEEALDADPTLLEALEVLATALAEVQEWGELERVYGKMIARFEKRPRDEATTHVLVELHRRMALLHRDHLEDPESALEELDKELALRPKQLGGQLLAAEVAEEVGDHERAMRYLRRAARLDPTRSETYHQLFVAARRADDTECAFLAASVAVQMGAEDDRERAIYQSHRVTGPPPHRRQLSEEAWDWLRDERRDLKVERIMHAIAPAVVRHRVRQLDSAGALPRLPEEGPQDPSTSTVSALRSVAWAAQYLGLTCPDLYAGEELTGGLSAPFAFRPSTFIGREVLTGKTLLELAFLAGRHLALRVPEHELVAHLSSIDELSACFLAALHMVLGNAPGAGKLGKAGAALAKLLERQMEEQEIIELEEAVNAFSEAGGRAELKRWVSAVEVCAARAGFLLCGDLATAVRLVREDPGNFASADRLTHDLYAFAVSDEHLALRDELGSAIGLEEDEAITG